MEEMDIDPPLFYFHFICKNGNYEAIETSLKKSDEEEIKRKLDSRVVEDSEAEPHTRGYSALHFAAENGNIDVVKLLLKYGADVNAMSEIGPPLHVSIVFFQKDVFLLLLEKGANINALIDGHVNAYQLMFENTYEEEDVTISWINFLNESGCNINHQNHSGNTALHLAPIFAVESILQCGAGINIINNMSMTAIIFQESLNDVNDEFYLIVCKHDIKLDIIKYYINNQNRNSLDETMKKFASYRTFNETICDFKQQCSDATWKLRSIKLSPKICLYDTLLLDSTRLSYYVDNDTLQEVYSMNDFHLHFYPYNIILKMQMKNAKVRKQLLNEAIVILEDFFLGIILKYCIEKILGFLTNNDLRDLVSKSNILN